MLSVNREVIEAVGKRWWMLVLRGLIAIIFGIMAWAWTGITLNSLILVVGIYIIADGIVSVAASFARIGQGYGFWPMLLLGFLSILFGLAIIAWPDLTAIALMYWIGAWAIVTGIMEIIGAIHYRKVLPDVWSPLIGGALALIFGILVVIAPGAGALALVKVIGLFAIFFGVAEIALGFRLRDVADGRS